eukprot:g8090.t1
MTTWSGRTPAGFEQYTVTFGEGELGLAIGGYAIGAGAGAGASASAGADAGAGAHMSSGHSAGLLGAGAFAIEAEQLRRRQERELAGADDALLGKGAETVVRDRRGRRLTMMEEMLRQQRAAAGGGGQGASRFKEEEEYEWGAGRAQRQERVTRADEQAAVAAAPFARHAGDAALEETLRGRAREGDPMAHLARAGAAAGAGGAGGGAAGGGGGPARKVYKGPPPAPNRFGLVPGYRWDGVDRGNGWEAKVAQQRNAAAVKKSEHQAWSCADM